MKNSFVIDDFMISFSQTHYQFSHITLKYKGMPSIFPRKFQLHLIGAFQMWTCIVMIEDMCEHIYGDVQIPGVTEKMFSFMFSFIIFSS